MRDARSAARPTRPGARAHVDNGDVARKNNLLLVLNWQGILLLRRKSKLWKKRLPWNAFTSYAIRDPDLQTTYAL